MDSLIAARLVPYLGLALVVFCNIGANLLMKTGAGSQYTPILWVMSWPSLLGIGLFAGSALAYAWTLRFVPLHEAQIFTSLQYVGVILAAAFVLGEDIGRYKMIGIALIAAGIGLCLKDVK